MENLKKNVYVSEDGQREFESPHECLNYDKFVALKAIMCMRVPVSDGIGSETSAANFIIDNFEEILKTMISLDEKMREAVDAARKGE